MQERRRSIGIDGYPNTCVANELKAVGVLKAVFVSDRPTLGEARRDMDTCPVVAPLSGHGPQSASMQVNQEFDQDGNDHSTVDIVLLQKGMLRIAMSVNEMYACRFTIIANFPKKL